MGAPERTTHATLPALPATLLPRLRQLEWRQLLEAREATIAVVLVVMCTVMSVAYPEFRTLGNVQNVLQAVAQTAIVGVGMTMIIVTGGIDVSVGSALSVCTVVVGMRLQHGAGAPEAIVIAIAVDLAIGLVNGLV